MEVATGSGAASGANSSNEGAVGVVRLVGAGEAEPVARERDLAGLAARSSCSRACAAEIGAGVVGGGNNEPKAGEEPAPGAPKLGEVAVLALARALAPAMAAERAATFEEGVFFAPGAVRGETKEVVLIMVQRRVIPRQWFH